MIRKGTAMLLSALLLASAMPFAVSAEEVSAKTTEYVNFRTGPGTNYSSKGVIPSGTGITVTDTPATFTPSTFPFPAAILPKTGR